MVKLADYVSTHRDSGEQISLCSRHPLRARTQGRGDGPRRLAGSVSGTGAAWTAGQSGENGRRTTLRPLVSVTGVHHGVVGPVMADTAVKMCVPAECETGEENDRDDEHDPGNNRHPRGDLIEPVRLCRRRWGCARRRRCGGDRSRPGRGFRCFTHTSHHARNTNSPGYVLLMKPL